MLAAFVVTFVFLLSVASSRAEQVRIAYSAISGAMAPLWIAHDDGLFQRQGIQAQLLYIGGGSVVTQALLGGDVQFVRLGANAVVQASLRGASLKMIANTINTLVFSLMSRPEIQSPKDLKGKKIGVTRLGGSTDFALELALKKWGFRRGADVAVIQTGGMPQLLGAITSGIVDAGVVSPPTNLTAAKLGLKELVDFGDIGIIYPTLLSPPRRRSWKKTAAPPCASCVPVQKGFIASGQTGKQPVNCLRSTPKSKTRKFCASSIGFTALNTWNLFRGSSWRR
jgi:ABC-type nitrate/sulfonate/bicarbonate transport system substrate-binding protein